MKKIITYFMIGLFLSYLTIGFVEARGSYSRGSSYSSSSRSSFGSSSRSSSYGSSSRSSFGSSSNRSSTKTTTSKPKPKTIINNNRTTIIENKSGGGGLLESAGGAFIGVIGANMLMNSLSNNQTLGNTVNDGEKIYNEVLDEAGNVVGYKEATNTGALATNTGALEETKETKEANIDDKENRDFLTFIAVLIFFVSIAGILFYKPNH